MADRAVCVEHVEGVRVAGGASLTRHVRGPALIGLAVVLVLAAPTPGLPEETASPQEGLSWECSFHLGRILGVQPTSGPTVTRVPGGLSREERELREIWFGRGSGGTDEACLNISADIGIINREIGGGVGLGTLPGVPGSEPLFLLHDGRLMGGKSEFGMEIALPTHSFGLSGSYAWASGDAATTEPIGGDPVAWTFGQDVFGSPGVGMGVTGATARSRISSESYGLDFFINPSAGRPAWISSDFTELLLSDRLGRDGAPMTNTLDVFNIFNGIDLGLVASVEHTNQRQVGDFVNLSFPDQIHMEVERRLDSTAVGLGPKFELTQPLGGGWFLTAGGVVQLRYRHSRLTSAEHVTCTICGGLPPQFDVDVTDSASGLDWNAGLDLTIGYQVAPRAVISAGGTLDVGGRDVINVRENPAEPHTGIRRITGVDWGFKAALNVGF